jgi:hypothetical protein
MRIGVVLGSVASALVGLLLIRFTPLGSKGDPELAAQEKIAEAEGVMDAP